MLYIWGNYCCVLLDPYKNPKLLGVKNDCVCMCFMCVYVCVYIYIYIYIHFLVWEHQWLIIIIIVIIIIIIIIIISSSSSGGGGCGSSSWLIDYILGSGPHGPDAPRP